MKNLRLLITPLVAAILLGLTFSVTAQNDTSSWPYSIEINTSGAAGMFQTIVPFVVLDKANEDLSDLRIYDGNGQEIPYAIRTLKESNARQAIGANIFNHAILGSSSEVSLDLGENHSSHNEIEIDTSGTNFRRRVVVEGSDSGGDWRTLSQDNLIFSFRDQNSYVNSNRVAYPLSRYRYLRVRVNQDELSDDVPPEITGARVMMAVHEQGLLSTWSVPVPYRELRRNDNGAPASAWNIDLGALVPCDRLTLEIFDESFSRHFELETLDDPQNIRQIAAGDLVRRIDSERKPLTIFFDREERVRKLRLVVNDYSNPPLEINGIDASAPARQLVFELKGSPRQPLRLFFGSRKITAPHYDFEKNLADKLKGEPAVATFGNVVSNASYTPEPLPFTERVPWLIYLILAASTAALGWILIKLGRRTAETQSSH
jgi:hypothetical protein